MTAAVGVLLCGSRLFAETDEEMIKRVGLDPRSDEELAAASYSTT